MKFTEIFGKNFINYSSQIFSKNKWIVITLFVLLFSINCSSYPYTQTYKRSYAELSASEKEALLAEHNKWRSRVGVSALKWSSEMEELARDWAYKLSRNYGCRMMHGSSNYGENIFWSNYPVTAKYVVDYWAEERFNYDYLSDSCKAGKACGHYTQIVWRETREVGCGRALCQGGEEIWVCNYNPAGNTKGKKPY